MAFKFNTKNANKCFGVTKACGEDNLRFLASTLGTNAPIGFMINFIDHPRLTTIFTKWEKGLKYYNLRAALNSLIASDILVCIKQLDAYIKFENVEDYRDFIRNIHLKMDLDPDMYKKEEIITAFTPYQIVLANQTQKVVFLATGNDEDIKAVLEKCKEVFRQEVIILEGENNVKEITVQLSVDNLKMAEERINDLHSRLVDEETGIHERVDIKMPRIEKLDEKQYIRCLLAVNEKTLIDSLKNVRDLYIINNNGNNYQVLCDLPVINVDNRLARTKEWIGEQSIEAKTSTSEMYENYKDHIKKENFTPMNRCDFNKIVEETHDCKNKKSRHDGKHYFEKSKK